MSFFIGILWFGYLTAFVYYSHKLMSQIENETDQQLEVLQHDYDGLLIKKNSLHDEKLAVEGEALRIFTLYEVTKEIAKNIREEEAFETFKRKLKENINFEECLLLDPLDEDIEHYLQTDEFFVLRLGKAKQMGYVVIKGMKGEDKEKVVILGHQLALGLRRIHLYEQIEKIAITDSLTALHTRRYALERLQEELERSRVRKIRLSIIMMDVDSFKKFNDKYGHLTGDQILREIGTIVKANIREIDIAGRYGGEEFMVVLPDTGREGAQFAAERIRQAAEVAAIKAYDTHIKVTVSIGIATYPDDAKKTEELIDKADWALYRSKKLGRNRVSSFGVYED